MLITGASGAIGSMLTNKFSQDRFVVGTYNKTKKEGLVKLDLLDEEQVEHFVEQHEIDEFIHCAGVTTLNMIHKVPVSDWDHIMNVNLKSAFILSKHLIPKMKEKGYGRIVFMSSIAAHGSIGTSAYSAAKSGLWGLAKTIGKETATKGITCNCLNLGYFDIGMISTVPKKHLDEVVEKHIPMKKLGDPENIYKAVQFVLDCDYITGNCIDINGGII